MFNYYELLIFNSKNKFSRTVTVLSSSSYNARRMFEIELKKTEKVMAIYPKI